MNHLNLEDEFQKQDLHLFNSTKEELLFPVDSHQFSLTQNMPLHPAG